eukprot:tig00020944_g16390.t1
MRSIGDWRSIVPNGGGRRRGGPRPPRPRSRSRYLAYVLARRYLRRRHGLKAVEILDDLEREGETGGGRIRLHFPAAFGPQKVRLVRLRPPPPSPARFRSAPPPLEVPLGIGSAGAAGGAAAARPPPPALAPSSTASSASASASAPTDRPPRPRLKSMPSLTATATAAGGAPDIDRKVDAYVDGGGAVLRNVVFLPNDR